MRTFTMTSLAHQITAVTDAADREAVALTHHGKETYVLMRMDEYARLSRSSGDPRRAQYTSNMPEALQELFFQDVPVRSAAEMNLVRGELPYDPARRIDVLAAEDDDA
ncbi:type II toxin-antitoxin system Phd/YefM family antitoxin [Aurantimonas sp. 22II-16-19i]|uniref:type II toxin-antitoxin system Phd/YefM family antitoxin n=1 Tax=Aurantimonas sp. 22II-16-19i TaxID=1317114 RepID=UPI00111BF1BC|nr:type II toxin-antitoxin system Phd/YefM family antitoxin [Aurantimonas sp. 22II-16-19i]